MRIPFARIYDMTLRIDHAGRIVIPKAVRERFGLRPGTDLEVCDSPEGLILKPLPQRPSLVREKGVWVHQGVPRSPIDLTQSIEQIRQDRARSIVGT
jgi:AbrB family looped-hinge helix DNA binding protein